MSVSRTPFGTTRDGQAVELLTLRCGAMEAEILTFGATVRALRVPDKNGNSVDVVLGYNTVSAYETNDGYVGALVGRYANRIANASYVIDGERIALEANEGTKQLHGGTVGFSHRVFTAEIVGDSSICLRYTAQDGEGGHPGTLTLRATYTLTEDTLFLRYEAESDQSTYCNLTNHSYFNLNGHGDILSHKLQIFADHFTPVDENSIPTAMATPVASTAFDFTLAKAVGRDICADEEQLRLTSGYDHNFVLSPAQGLRRAAYLVGEESGITMETLTEKPGVQLYTANFLDAALDTKCGQPYQKHEALCLETQFFPDSPNHPEWGDIVLRPGQRYDYTTAYRFSTEN